MTTVLVIFIILTFVLTYLLADSDAAREAKEHHQRNVIEQLEDFLKNKNIDLSFRLKNKIDADYKVDKHFVYTVTRLAYFCIVLYSSYCFMSYHPVIYSIIHLFSLLFLFRGIHDSYYYQYRFYLDNSIMKYSKGFWSEGDNKDSGILDFLFGDSLLQRMICIVVGIVGEIFLLISI